MNTLIQHLLLTIKRSRSLANWALVFILAPSTHAQDLGAKSLLASRFVVTERISLIDTQDRNFSLEAGIMPLSLDQEDFSETMDSRGGDGEPPRGPVRVSFRNDSRSGRGILELKFSNRRALFWLENAVETTEDGSPVSVQSVRARSKNSGQNLGARLSTHRNSRDLNPLTLLLLENDVRAVADIELIENP